VLRQTGLVVVTGARGQLAANLPKVTTTSKAGGGRKLWAKGLKMNPTTACPTTVEHCELGRTEQAAPLRTRSGPNAEPFRRCSQRFAAEPNNLRRGAHNPEGELRRLVVQGTGIDPFSSTSLVDNCQLGRTRRNCHLLGRSLTSERAAAPNTFGGATGHPSPF